MWGPNYVGGIDGQGGLSLGADIRESAVVKIDMIAGVWRVDLEMLCHGRPLDIASLINVFVDLVLELLHDIVVERPSHEGSAVATDWHWL